ncbi:MAG TPA: cytochrome b N-terminal domain-containing protein, partial [Acidocella sp.]|nr:cytochrome b N-terminal domain-containing protein [Acidocella sp.]
MSDQTKSWLETRLPLASSMQSCIWNMKMAVEKPYLAALGSLITATLIFLTLSGFVLSLFYVAAPGAAFDSIQFISRNVDNGWLVRSFHATGATMLFAATYLVVFRTLLTGGYRAPNELTWILKLVFLGLVLIIGYFGYAMADGAVSYWSLHETTVAGARLTSFPGAISNWVFGGPAGPGTLGRVAVLHSALALLGFGVLALHLAAKRAVAPVPTKTVTLHPYYTSHHFVAFAVFALIFAVLVFFAPHWGENQLNLAAANPLVVPAVLTPPWYLLPVSAFAAASSSPLGSIFLVLAGFAVLFAAPWLDQSKGTKPGLFYKILVAVLALDVFGLCMAQADGPSMLSSILSTIFIGWYFLHFLVPSP